MASSRSRVHHPSLALQSGDAGLAEVAAARAAAQFAAIPDPIREADALRVVGSAAVAQEKLDTAANALERALALARAYGSSLIEAEALFVRATLGRSANDAHSARKDAEAAAAIYERLGATAARTAVLDWLKG